MAVMRETESNAHSWLICAAVAAVHYLPEIARNRCAVTSAAAGCSAGAAELWSIGLC